MPYGGGLLVGQTIMMAFSMNIVGLVAHAHVLKDSANSFAEVNVNELHMATLRADSYRAAGEDQNRTRTTVGRPALKVGQLARNTTKFKAQFMKKLKSNLRDSTKKLHNNCSLVFGSGSILKWTDGARIDQFPRVYRFNMAPMGEQYRNAVGSKTTHEVVHFFADILSQDDKKHGKQSPAELFAQNASQEVIGLSFDVDSFDADRYSALHKKHPKWEFVPKAHAEKCKKLIGEKCSSGMLTVLRVLDDCRTAVIFGAELDTCYPYHYWGDLEEAKHSAACKKAQNPKDAYKHVYKKPDHDFHQEHRVLEGLAAEGRVEFAHVSNPARKERMARTSLRVPTSVQLNFVT